MDFQTAHQRHGGEDRQLSRVAYLNKVKNMSPKANLVTYGAGKIPSNLIEYFDKTDPGSNGKPAARRQRRSPRAKFGTHHAFHARSPAKAPTPPRATSAYRTPERKILSFNSPRAPGRKKRNGHNGCHNGRRWPRVHARVPRSPVIALARGEGRAARRERPGGRPAPPSGRPSPKV